MNVIDAAMFGLMFAALIKEGSYPHTDVRTLTMVALLCATLLQCYRVVIA